MRHARVMLYGSVLLAACSNGSAKSAGGSDGAGGGAPSLPVEVAVAREDTVVDAITSTGQVEAVQSTDLQPEVEGRIVEILMREGAEVGAGQPLFRIDDQELKAQVERAEAERDLSDQALARTRQLLAQDAASTSDLERAEATARSNRASLELLKLRLARTTVRAPFSGVVGQRFVSIGDYVTTSTRLVTIETVDPQQVSFSVPERHAAIVHRGQKVTFRVASQPGEEFTGIVEFVSPRIQLPARTLLVKARVPNGRRKLQSGMFVETRLATEVRPRAVVIPEDAVLTVQGQTFVWVVADGKASRRAVTLGVRAPGQVEIPTGVEPDEQVVVGGLELLQEGASVAPTVVDRSPAVPGEVGASAGSVPKGSSQ